MAQQCHDALAVQALRHGIEFLDQRMRDRPPVERLRHRDAVEVEPVTGRQVRPDVIGEDAADIGRGRLGDNQPAILRAVQNCLCLGAPLVQRHRVACVAHQRGSHIDPLPPKGREPIERCGVVRLGLQHTDADIARGSGARP